MTPDTAIPRRRGRPQSVAAPFDPVDPTLDEPVERQVYRSLRRGMMQGLIAPDTVLTGRSLAQHMGLSVQPVRDALKRLEADGAIIGRPQSGFHLPAMTAAEYWESIEIRTRLEGLAGRLAAAEATPDLVARLHRMNDAMQAMSAPREYLAVNFAFHFAIYAQARRATLLSLIENFWVRIGPVLHHHQADHVAGGSYAKHIAIISALAAGDGPGTEQAIIEDLVSAAHVVVQGLQRSTAAATE
jgi:GntR family transcriptional regulator, colanic acid and biofilm gene transcriptional regulator